MVLAREPNGNPALVQLALAGLASDQARVRLGASKTLRLLSQEAPELVYPHFETFARMLAHPNSVLRWNAILTLGNLAAVDQAGKLDGILDTYLSPIAGPHLIDAANTIHGAANIARAKPHLAKTIAEAILQVSEATYATAECRNVAIGHAIVALLGMSEQENVIEFVTGQLRNPRPATRRKAELFVRKFGSQLSAGVACLY
jgi:hypothetical protein